MLLLLSLICLGSGSCAAKGEAPAYRIQTTGWGCDCSPEAFSAYEKEYSYQDEQFEDIVPRELIFFEIDGKEHMLRFARKSFSFYQWAPRLYYRSVSNDAAIRDVSLDPYGNVVYVGYNVGQEHNEGTISSADAVQIARQTLQKAGIADAAQLSAVVTKLTFRYKVQMTRYVQGFPTSDTMQVNVCADGTVFSYEINQNSMIPQNFDTSIFDLEEIEKAIQEKSEYIYASDSSHLLCDYMRHEKPSYALVMLKDGQVGLACSLTTTLVTDSDGLYMERTHSISYLVTRETESEL